MRIALVALLAGCLQSAAPVCDNGVLCPPEQVCDDVHGICVYPDQLTSCGAENGAACSITEIEAGGECVDDVCIAQRCGDGLVTGDEVCEGEGTVPGSGTCVDFNFDYGSLACSNVCAADTSACGILGWRFVALDGVGTVGGFAESDDHTVWMAATNGIYRRDLDGSWHALGFVTEVPLQAFGIWAGDGHVFVVGVDPRNGDGCIEMFDGATWSVRTDLSPGFFLEGVWGANAHDVYVVGGSDTILHFDGTTWSPVPHTKKPDRDLKAVWGSGSYVVAGGVASSIFLYELTPTGVTEPTIVNGAGKIHSISGLDPEHVVIGLEGSFVITRGADHVYREVQALDSNPTFVALAVAARSANEIYLAGGPGAVTGSVANLYRGDGTEFSLVTMPLSDPLNAIFATSATLYAGGTTQSVMEYSGAGWSTFAAPGMAVDATAVWTDGKFIAAGVSGAQVGCLIQEREQVGSVWQWQAGSFDASCSALCNQKNPTFTAIGGTAASDLYAIGAQGRVAHRQTGGWSCKPVPAEGAGVPPDLFGVASTGASEAWVVGSDHDNTSARIYHYAGLDVTDRTSTLPAGTPALRGVGGTNTDLFAVGIGGAIVHFDGTAWSAMTSPSSEALFGVYAAASNDVFAVGAHGTILHYDGTAWSVMPLPTGITLSTTVDYTAVHGTSGHDVYAVGGRVLLRYDGTRWAPVARPDVGVVRSVLALPDDVFVAGSSGVGMHLSGALK